MSGEVPVWVGGNKKWVTGLGKKTTCDDVIKALLEADRRTGNAVGGSADVAHYVIVERWRKVERPLEPKTKLLKAWNSWGEEQSNVRLSLKATSHNRHRSGKAAESSSSSKTYRRKPQAKVKWRQMVGAKTTTIHPKKLVMLQQQESGRRCYSESMERLMKVIIAQGETIQQQLKRLETKEEQIESYEQRLHANRVQTMGANYLLDTYLTSGRQQEAEVVEEEAKVKRCIRYYERVLRLSEQLEREESTLQWLSVEMDSERQLAEGQRSLGVGEGVEEMVEEVRAKVERMGAINQRNLVELESNEMQLAKLNVWLDDKGCFVRHLECDLREAEVEQRQLEAMVKNVCCVHGQQSIDSQLNCSSNTKDILSPQQDNDSNSDTGLSSLHSSSDDVILDTLV